MVRSCRKPAGPRRAAQCLATIVLLLAGLVAPAQQNDATILGRQCALDFHQGRHDELWARMSSALQANLGSAAKLAELLQRVREDAGTEASLLRERVDTSNGARAYVREAQFTRAGIATRCAFDAENRIAAFEVRPLPVAAPSTHLAYETRASLRLPFEGEWYTFWGGRTIEQNYHAASQDQRFAYDFLVIADGATYAGDPTRLEHFHCWNRKILAPAAGTVVSVRDGIADNVPGVMNPAIPPGNHVILDLGQGEFALLGHLKQSSIVVKEAQRVRPGQELGRCGNSGNSSEPHLHFHLQNAPGFGQGAGLPAKFNNYVADGIPVRRGEPVRGQRVRPRE